MKPRGILKLIRETWTGENKHAEKTSLPVTCYLEKLETYIREAVEAAGVNERKAHDRNKRQFDKRATPRTLTIREKVLVLLPTGGSSLMACWDGPFEVLEACANNNYVIDMRGHRTYLHINALRKYEEKDQDQDVFLTGTNQGNRVVTVPMVISTDMEPRCEALTGERGEPTPTTTDDQEYSVGTKLTSEQ